MKVFFQWIIHGLDTAKNVYVGSIPPRRRLIIVYGVRVFPNANNPTPSTRKRLSWLSFGSRAALFWNFFASAPKRPFTTVARRDRVNGPRTGEWRAKELVVMFPLWRVLGNPSMGNLFVKNGPLSRPLRRECTGDGDDETRIIIIIITLTRRRRSLYVIKPLLSTLYTFSHQPGQITRFVWFCTFFFPFYFIVIYSFGFFFFTPSTDVPNWIWTASVRTTTTTTSSDTNKYR